MKCISFVRYSIIINGVLEGSIQLKRGIRQGDPLSPYLFILCVEALSSNLMQAEQSGSMRGVPTSPRGLRLNHLFFADDSLLFCKATTQDWQRLTIILEGYEQALGQRLNRDRTSIFFSRNTRQEVGDLILRLSGVPTTQRYDKYLGLPVLVGKSRIREFQSLTERVRKKVSDWKMKFLS